MLENNTAEFLQTKYDKLSLMKHQLPDEADMELNTSGDGACALHLLHQVRDKIPNCRKSKPHRKMSKEFKDFVENLTVKESDNKFLFETLKEKISTANWNTKIEMDEWFECHIYQLLNIPKEIVFSIFEISPQSVMVFSDMQLDRLTHAYLILKFSNVFEDKEDNFSFSKTSISNLRLLLNHYIAHFTCKNESGHFYIVNRDPSSLEHLEMAFKSFIVEMKKFIESDAYFKSTDEVDGTTTNNDATANNVVMVDATSNKRQKRKGSSKQNQGLVVGRYDLDDSEESKPDDIFKESNVNLNSRVINLKYMKNMTKKQINIDTYVVNEHEMKLLSDPNGWLNDEIINLWVDIIIQNTYKVPSIMFLTSFAFQQYMITRFTNTNYITENEITNKEFLIAPLNVENQHWTIVIIYLFKNKIVVYDSLNNQNISENVISWLQHTRTHITNVLATCKMIDSRVKFDENAIISLSPFFPQQKDGCSCGVFVCKGIETFFENRQEIITWSDISESVRKYRDEMTKFFLSLFESGDRW